MHRKCCNESSKKWLSARAVIGFFPANSVGDDIEVYRDETCSEAAFHFCDSKWRNAKGREKLLPLGFRRAEGDAFPTISVVSR